MIHQPSLGAMFVFNTDHGIMYVSDSLNSLSHVTCGQTTNKQPTNQPTNQPTIMLAAFFGGFHLPPCSVHEANLARLGFSKKPGHNCGRTRILAPVAPLALWAQYLDNWSVGDPLGNPGVVTPDGGNPTNMGVSNNRGTPKWMIYNGKPY